MTATAWPSSEYAAKCAWCGTALASAEPRIREDDVAQGLRGRRTWHPECYATDPYGQKAQGDPRIPHGAPMGSRGVRPGTGGPAIPPSPSPAAPPSADPTSMAAGVADAMCPPPAAPISAMPREIGYRWVTVEAEATATGSREGASEVYRARGLARMAQLVPISEADATEEVLRGLVVASSIHVAREIGKAIVPAGERAEGVP